MSYLVLARKYRPQKFSEIVGQEHIVTTLKNALKSGKVWHAYIFAGMRGTGKTTTARVLAKAVNCLSPSIDFEPCNKCKNCVEITQGICMDVIEIDAASNRGIDDVRALRETVKYVPVSCKYKVYIIDEAHQITDAAFNALLKTLEEPPSYVIFILATTEFNALPLTIISRCQVFHFRPISSNIIFDQLKNVLKQENKEDKISDDALKLISDASSGSVRDALSLLDQIMSFTEIHNIVDINIVRQIFGSTPVEVIHNYINLIIEGNPKKIIEYINKIYYSGVDLIQFSKDLLEFFHSLLYAKTGTTETSSVNVTQYLESFSLTQIMVFIQQCMRLVEEIKRTDYPKTIFEIYSLRFTKQYLDINEILKNLEDTVTNVIKPSINNTTLSTQTVPTQSSLDPSTETKQINLDIEHLWDKILEKIREEKPLIYPSFDQSEVSFCNNTLTIFFPNEYVKTIVENYNLNLEKIVEEITGNKIKVCYTTLAQKKIVFGQDMPETTQPQQPQKVINAKSKRQKTIDPVAEKIATMFSGKIISQDNKKEEEED
ncbi:MAG: DNA polymerase III subunit gamma/tau [Endomicrobia bacterium]|nr:DNA polymerase III subunit gamma/tau [Endomicrobiia bacterium]MDW8056544.1 DNA polymerase III subunit gamma/tau [Elusimicrobiota bacterium]